MNLFDVKDRVVVVTGGLGQLGRQFSRTLDGLGAKVAILDAAISDETIAKHYPNDSGRFLFVRTDVTDRESVRESARQVKDALGVPHALINNAALDTPPGAPASENGPYEDYPESSFDEVLDVNVKGVHLTCQEVGGRMAEAGRGSIINISSIYGIVSPNQQIYEYRRRRGEEFFKPVAYSVSKSALLNLTRYLATYWAPRGVRVNTLTFGGVFNDQDTEFLDEYTRRVPLGRMAREDDYNGAVVFLVSDASAYMTGSNLIIDGGWTAW